MAEIVIPMALLGGMYILSNDDNKNSKNNKLKEGYSGMNNTPLPNTKNIPTNFPINGQAELKNNVNYYPNGRAVTDKHFQETEYIQKLKDDDNKYESLTGNKVEADEFKHKNMQPFFGSKVMQNNNYINESRLDNMVGSGSQHFSKKEVAPLFKPQENMQWGHGTPNMSNFFQSRMNPSMNMSNVKPFQEVRVAPGLNDRNGVLGSGGFNSGMEARERWMPKTVDELRVNNNPKVTYGGVTLGGKRSVQNRGVMGKFEKYKPDSYFINTPERYLTTTGLEKAQTARSIQMLKNENRTNTTTEYFGVGNDAQGEASYIPGNYQEAKRPQLDPNYKHITNTHFKNGNVANEGDYGIIGFKQSVKNNNRTITGDRQKQYGTLTRLTKAIVTPIMDVLRPTRKENIIGNARPVGNVGSNEINASYVKNSNDRAKTTNRETTEERPQHYNINNQGQLGGYGYITNEPMQVTQQRDFTNVEYSGGANGINGNENPMNYDYMYNAHLINKEPISRGRNPMGSNVKMFNNQQNIKIDKLQSDRCNNRMNVPQNIMKIPASKQIYGASTRKDLLDQNIHLKRNTPEIVSVLKNNPYAKPLDSVA